MAQTADMRPTAAWRSLSSKSSKRSSACVYAAAQHAPSASRQQYQQHCHRRRQEAVVAAVAAGTPASGLQQPAAAEDVEARTAGGSKSVLFISSVWPERSSSAAGVRSCDLLASFQQRGWAAAYASSSAANEHTAALQASGVSAHCCPPNREAALAGVLAGTQPSAIVFDRFYSEEAFSFRVRELLPGALRVLDMQDFHALRACRQALAQRGAPLAEVLAARPDAEAPDCLRELAAIHRSDLTLVCSPVELDMLTRHYGVPASKLALASFFPPPSLYAPHLPAAAAAAATEADEVEGGAQPPSPPQAAAALPTFQQRRHFAMIGTWRHPPNLDSARWAATEVWPVLRAVLPPEERATAELHMYGAYAAGAAQQLHRPKEGVHMKGFAPSLEDVMLNYRVLLAPLRYGAGLKGKVVDSWWHGLPVVTTPIGAEGMTAADADAADLASAGAGMAAVPAADPAANGYVWQLRGTSSSNSNAADGSSSSSSSGAAEWGGLCGATTAEGIAASAALLYTDEELWGSCQQRGFQLLRLLYDRERNLERVHAAIDAVAAGLEERRRRDFVGAMLWSQQLRATEYFSRWIELKEAAKEAAEAQQ